METEGISSSTLTRDGLSNARLQHLGPKSLQSELLVRLYHGLHCLLLQEIRQKTVQESGLGKAFLSVGVGEACLLLLLLRRFP